MKSKTLIIIMSVVIVALSVTMVLMFRKQKDKAQKMDSKDENSVKESKNSNFLIDKWDISKIDSAGMLPPLGAYPPIAAYKDSGEFIWKNSKWKSEPEVLSSGFAGGFLSKYYLIYLGPAFPTGLNY